MVGVMVGEGRTINDEVTLLWEDKKFKVLVEEETSIWTPDFLNVKEADVVGTAAGGITGGGVPTSPIDVSPEEFEKMQEVDKSGMHEKSASDVQMEFPKWEGNWDKGELNSAQSSKAGFFNKGDNVRLRKVGLGKGKSRVVKKAQKVFLSGLGQERSNKRKRLDPTIEGDISSGAVQINGDTTEGVSVDIAESSNHLDINIDLPPPISGEQDGAPSTEIEREQQEVDHRAPAEVPSGGIHSSEEKGEVESTVNLAAKLGVNLKDHLDLVTESIRDGGIQLGKL
ncbi:hypothetical protein Hanom_Chr02g00139361 [Helianthus anomalus]